MNKTSIKLQEKEELGVKHYKYVFNKPFDFEAGQFVSFIVGEKLKRYYSIASSPQEDDFIFYVTTMPGGPGSQFFEKINVGDKADIIGPMGKFTYKENADACFIATGTGVAPLISIIKDELLKGNKSQLYLLYGVRYEDNVMVEPLLRDLSEKYPNFKYDITVSRPTETWHGLRGRVTAHLENINTSIFQNYYLCGVKDMVMDVKGVLKSRGIDQTSIFSELY